MAQFYSNTANPQTRDMNKQIKSNQDINELVKKRGGFFNRITSPNQKYNEMESSFGTASKYLFNKPKVTSTNPVSNQSISSQSQYKSTPSVRTNMTTKPLIGAGGVANQPKPQFPSFSPQSYASNQENIINRITALGDRYSDRIAAPYAQAGIGEGQKRLSDYELARYNAQLEGLGKAGEFQQGLVTASLPQAYAPGSTLLTPINQQPVQGYSPTASAFQGGQIGAVSNLGGQSVGYGNQFNQLSGVQGLLNNAFQGYTNFGLVPLNEWKNRIASLASSGQLAQIQTNLSGIADSLPEGEVKNQLKQMASNLSNSSPSAINSAIEAAKSILQTQQQAAYQTAGIGGGGDFAENW